MLPRLRLDHLLVLVLALAMLAMPVRAHEIPQRISALMFVKPEGRTMHIVLRVPLEAMRDVNFPLRGEYIEASRSQPLLRDPVSLWIVDHLSVLEEGQRLISPKIVQARISLPSDRSFTSYDRALAHVTRDPLLPDSIELPWRQAMLDVVLSVPIGSASSRFALEPTLSGLALKTVSVVHFLPPGSPERVFEYEGDPGVVALDPSWTDAALRFLKLGVEHILSGIDHLLFVLCLVIPLRRVKALVGVVTAFTAAHSITLIASALGLAPTALWFPPLIELLVAVSIVYMSFENMVAKPEALERRWMLAFGFGLVHGFAFSFALQNAMQFAGTHMLAALLTFNLGVEIGQVMVIAAAVPLLAVFFRNVAAERAGVMLLSALVAHTAWHWMLDRGEVLRQYRMNVPALDLAFAAGALRVLMLLIIIGVVAWLMSKVVSGTADSSLRSE